MYFIPLHFKKIILTAKLFLSPLATKPEKPQYHQRQCHCCIISL